MFDKLSSWEGGLAKVGARSSTEREVGAEEGLSFSIDWTRPMGKGWP